MTATLLSTNSFASARNLFGLFGGKTIFKLDVLALHIAEVMKSFAQYEQIVALFFRAAGVPKDTNCRKGGIFGLLGAHHGWR